MLGESEFDGVGDRDFRRMGEVAKLDRFGWMIIGGKAEYKATDNLILEGAAGGFWTAKKTACPASDGLHLLEYLHVARGAPLISPTQLVCLLEWPAIFLVGDLVPSPGAYLSLKTMIRHR